MKAPRFIIYSIHQFGLVVALVFCSVQAGLSQSSEWAELRILKPSIGTCVDRGGNTTCFGLGCVGRQLKPIILETGGTAPAEFDQKITIDVDDTPTYCLPFNGKSGAPVSYYAEGKELASQVLLDKLRRGSHVSIHDGQKTVRFSLAGSTKAIDGLANICNPTSLPFNNTECAAPAEISKIGTLEWVIGVLNVDAENVRPNVSSVELVELDNNADTKEYFVQLGGPFFCGASYCSQYVIKNIDADKNQVLLDGISTIEMRLNDNHRNGYRSIDLCGRDGCVEWAYSPAKRQYDLFDKAEAKRLAEEAELRYQKWLNSDAPEAVKIRKQRAEYERKRIAEQQRQRQQYLAQQRARQSNYQNQLFAPFQQRQTRTNEDALRVIDLLGWAFFVFVCSPAFFVLRQKYRESKNEGDWAKIRAWLEVSQLREEQT